MAFLSWFSCHGNWSFITNRISDPTSLLTPGLVLYTCPLALSSRLTRFATKAEILGKNHSNTGSCEQTPERWTSSDLAKAPHLRDRKPRAPHCILPSSRGCGRSPAGAASPFGVVQVRELRSGPALPSESRSARRDCLVSMEVPVTHRRCLPSLVIKPLR